MDSAAYAVVTHQGARTCTAGHAAAVGVRDEFDAVGQVKPALSFHHVGELAGHVPVLAVEGKLDVSLVVVKILGAHASSSACFGGRPRLARTGSASLTPRRPSASRSRHSTWALTRRR